MSTSTPTPSPTPFNEIPAIRFAIERAEKAVKGRKYYHYEHKVGTVGSSLLHNYFPLHLGYVHTPEQIQADKKKSDFVVEKLENDNFYYKVYLEFKKKGGIGWLKNMYQAACAAFIIADDK